MDHMEEMKWMGRVCWFEMGTEEEGFDKKKKKEFEREKRKGFSVLGNNNESEWERD